MEQQIKDRLISIVHKNHHHNNMYFHNLLHEIDHANSPESLQKLQTYILHVSSKPKSNVETFKQTIRDLLQKLLDEGCIDIHTKSFWMNEITIHSDESDLKIILEYLQSKKRKNPVRG